MQIVTLDFETYYDVAYTLRKLSTSEYIRDPRFEALSCSVKINKKKAKCYFGFDNIKSALDEIDWTKSTLLCHNTAFDGLILSHHFGIVPARYADTLSMARGLHSKSKRNTLEAVAIHYDVVNKLTMPEFKGKRLSDLTEDEIEAVSVYNNGDVESTYAVYQKMLEVFPPSELELIDITLRMFCDPILRVDLPLAKEELASEQERKEKAISATGLDIKVLASNPKFVAELLKHKVDIPLKPSKTVKDKMIPAVAKSDEELQALLLHPNPKVVALVEGRLAAKSTIGESRALRMIMSGSDDKKLPILLNYSGAHTHRWSGGDKFNPQNFKQKKKEGGRLRECILAPEGMSLVVVDAKQIEARVVAWLAGEEWVLEAFREGRDLYSEFASECYGRVVTAADKEERFVGKTCILGLGFQMGGLKLQTSLLTQSINQGLEPVRLPRDVCFRLVSTYRKKCQNVERLWNVLNNKGIKALYTGNVWEYKGLVFEKGQIKLPNGMYLRYPELQADFANAQTSTMFTGDYEEIVQNASYLTFKGRSKIYGGLLTENIVQALARIIVAEAMRIVAQKYRIVMMTHDELVVAVKTSEAQAVLDWIIELMRVAPIWAPDLPLDAEGGHDVCYSK